VAVVEVSLRGRAAAAEEDTGVEAMTMMEEEIGVERRRQRRRRPIYNGDKETGGDFRVLG
jgi:hypothetical protein